MAKVLCCRVNSEKFTIKSTVVLLSSIQFSARETQGVWVAVGNLTMVYQKSQVHIFLYFTNHYKYMNKYPVCVEWHGRDPEKLNGGNLYVKVVLNNAF